MAKKFTLLELLVVIAIIGILASILLPSLTKARQSGHSAVCKNNLKKCFLGGLRLSMLFNALLTFFKGGWHR